LARTPESARRVISSRTKLRAGAHVLLHDFLLITVPELRIGRGSQINAFTSITGRGRVLIGRDVVVSYGCRLITSSDSPEAKKMNNASPESSRLIRSGVIVLEDEVFVGANSVVMPGVRVGRRSVVGANSYVSRDVPPGVIGWGSPFVVLRKR